MNKIFTFGCKLNFYESEVIKKNLESVCHDLDNTTIINSCAVTNEAERKVKQKVRKIHKENPDMKIIIVGCAVQLKADEYAKLPGVIKVIGNGEKLKTENYINKSKVIVGKPNDTKLTTDLAKKGQISDKVRSFVQIQNGCNHDCTFCTITIARGNNVSVPIDDIINTIRRLVENGYNEIVLTGVDITDYGQDLYGKPSLSKLIRRILNSVTSLKRLRLSSVDVAEMDSEMIELIISEERLMQHIHISLQSGDNMILKRMKRRHTREDVINFCNKIKNKRRDVVFGADVIAGFPTETDEMFQNSVNLIKEANIIYLHVFPYSKKEGSKAALMPQLPREIVKERSKMLINLANEQLLLLYADAKNKVYNVIIEKDNVGRAENFALVRVKSNDLKRNHIYKIMIDGIDNGYLTGNLVQNDGEVIC